MTGKLEFYILQTQWPNYSEPVNEFECPLCDENIHPDLDKHWIREFVRDHIRYHHNVDDDKFTIVFKPKFTEKETNENRSLSGPT